MLDPQALLDVLVERVKEALQADTAAILLLDPSARQLVATAASGFGGRGPAGRADPGGQRFRGADRGAGPPGGPGEG
jgi:hypothetical protein